MSDVLIGLAVALVVTTAVWCGYMKYVERQRYKRDPGLKERQRRRADAQREKAAEAARRQAIISGAQKQTSNSLADDAPGGDEGSSTSIEARDDRV